MQLPTGTWPEQIDTHELIKQVSVLHGCQIDLDEGDLVERLENYEGYTLTLLPLMQVNPSEWELCEALIDDYARLLTPYPPIVFDAAQGSIIDGTHRVNAALRRGDTVIWAYVGEQDEN